MNISAHAHAAVSPGSRPLPLASRDIDPQAANAVERSMTDPRVSPASLLQQATVTRTLLDIELPGARAVAQPERALKPYGVAMLPETPVDGDSDEPDAAGPSPSEPPRPG